MIRTVDAATQIQRILQQAARTGNLQQLAGSTELMRLAQNNPAAFVTVSVSLAADTATLATRTARLDLHRHSIQMMRDCLISLRPWNWLRRRRIEHQLALIAISVGEDPQCTAM